MSIRVGGHGAWLEVTPKQRELLEFLGTSREAKTLVPFAAGTLSSLRKAGLIERVRVPSASSKGGSVAGYRVTDTGWSELTGRPQAARSLTELEWEALLMANGVDGKLTHAVELTAPALEAAGYADRVEEGWQLTGRGSRLAREVRR